MDFDAMKQAIIDAQASEIDRLKLINVRMQSVIDEYIVAHDNYEYLWWHPVEGQELESCAIILEQTYSKLKETSNYVYT